MLKGTVAIVTGLTSGIGPGIAKELARLGGGIALDGFGDAKEIEAIRSGIERAQGVRVAYGGADMSKGDAVRKLIEPTGDASTRRRLSSPSSPMTSAAAIEI